MTGLSSAYKYQQTRGWQLFRVPPRESSRYTQLSRVHMCIPPMNICSKSKIVLLKEWKSEYSPRFAALFSTQGQPFRLLLPPPCPPASTAPGEGLPGGLLEDSCGRRKPRSMPNRLKVGMYGRLVLLPFRNTKILSSVIRWRRKVRCGRVVKCAPAGSPFATRSAQWGSERQRGRGA